MTTKEEKEIHHSNECRLRSLRDQMLRREEAYKRYHEEVDERIEKALEVAKKTQSEAALRIIQMVFANIFESREALSWAYEGTKEAQALLKEVQDIRGRMFQLETQTTLVLMEIEHWRDDPYGFPIEAYSAVMDALDWLNLPMRNLAEMGRDDV